MENGPLLDDFPINTSIYKGFSMAMLKNQMIYIYIYTLWLFNIAMENGPLLDDFPINTSIYKGCSMAMLKNQMIYIYIPSGYLT